MPDRKQIGQNLVCTVVVVGFTAVLILMIVRPIPITDAMLQLLTLLLGTLAAKFGDVVQYYIGSSAGSRSKDEMLKDLAGAEKPASPAP